MFSAILFDVGGTLIKENPSETGSVDAEPTEGGPEVIRWVAERYDLGIVTNIPSRLRSDVRVLLDVAGYDLTWFDSIVSSRETGTEKPSPFIFEVVLQELGADPERAAMVGNRLDTDVAGAKRLGMEAIYIGGPIEKLQVSPNSTPDARIDNLRQLPRALIELSDIENPEER